MKKFIFFVVLMITLSGNQIACNSNSIAESTIPNQQEKVEINDIKFFTWWWSKEQIRAGIDADNAPDKTFYMQLNRWQLDGEWGVANPNKFDITFQISNPSNNATSLRVKAVVGFQIASYKLMYNEEERGGKLEDDFAKIPWTKEEEIYSSTINISPKSQEEIVIKDFNLRKVLDSLKGDDWAWYMKTRIVIENMEGVEITSKEKELEIVPLD